MKFRPQISPDRIALDGAGFELAANSSDLNFTRKSALNLQNLSSISPSGFRAL